MVTHCFVSLLSIELEKLQMCSSMGIAYLIISCWRLWWKTTKVIILPNKNIFNICLKPHWKQTTARGDVISLQKKDFSDRCRGIFEDKQRTLPLTFAWNKTPMVSGNMTVFSLTSLAFFGGKVGSGWWKKKKKTPWHSLEQQSEIRLTHTHMQKNIDHPINFQRACLQESNLQKNVFCVFTVNHQSTAKRWFRSILTGLDSCPSIDVIGKHIRRQHTTVHYSVSLFTLGQYTAHSQSLHCNNV